MLTAHNQAIKLEKKRFCLLTTGVSHQRRSASVLNEPSDRSQGCFPRSASGNTPRKANVNLPNSPASSGAVVPNRKSQNHVEPGIEINSVEAKGGG